MSGSRLASGSRVAVIGGGVAGAGLAAALLFNARTRGSPVEVRVYDGGAPGGGMAPAVLTAECRSRLAALGCRMPVEWRVHELRGVEVLAHGSRELLPASAGGVWVVDGWPHGMGGLELVGRALTGAATSQGAQWVERRVERVERQPPAPDAPAVVRRSGPLVVRAQGSGERYHAAVLATGASGMRAEAFFPGFAPAPTLSAVQARLRVNPSRPGLGPLVRLWLDPLPSVEGLLLVPAARSLYALAFGASVAPADLCQVLMMAARDGLLEEGFEVAELEPTRVPYGAGRRLVGTGQLVVGAAACGHPLQLGLSETLASCSRAAAALLDSELERSALEQRYVHEGVAELMEEAVAGARSLEWLRRAGRRGPGAFVTARRRGTVSSSCSGGVLGLSSPTPPALLGAARWAGMKEWLTSWVRTTVEPLPAHVPALEPDLYYVVDDDTDAREALTQLLESTGAEVVSFSSELALYCAVARRPPDAILLDVVLQWVDGLRLCEGLKQHPLTRGTRVVVMSGLNRPYVRQRALEAGAEAFMAKPLEPEGLLRVLRGGPAIGPSRQEHAGSALADEAGRHASSS